MTTAFIDGVPTDTGYDRYSGPDIPKDVAVHLFEWDWGGSWEFEILVIYKSATSSEIRAAVDSGCSCPTPFSGLTWDTMCRVNAVDDVLDLLGARGNYDTIVSQPPDEILATIKAFIHRYLTEAR